MGVRSLSQHVFNKTNPFLWRRMRHFKNKLTQTNIEKPELLCYLNKFWGKKVVWNFRILSKFSFLFFYHSSIAFLIGRQNMNCYVILHSSWNITLYFTVIKSYLTWMNSLSLRCLIQWVDLRLDCLQPSSVPWLLFCQISLSHFLWRNV